jgi:hypothetical protein
MNRSHKLLVLRTGDSHPVGETQISSGSDLSSKCGVCGQYRLLWEQSRGLEPEPSKGVDRGREGSSGVFI